MESPIAAIGFSDIENNYKIENIVSQILDKPTKQVTSRRPNSDILAEYMKEFAKDMYIMVRVVLKGKGKDAEIEVEQCEPYLEAATALEVEDLTVECVEDDYNYYGICEEKETGMQFIFWVQNAVDYLEANEDCSSFDSVKIAGLAMEGTIVVAIEKNEQDEAIEKEEREKIKVMLQKAREGDEEAKAKLEAEEKDLDNQLKERMYEEDFLSIMSGYFVPTTLVDATYAILGEIMQIQVRTNSMTNEEMYLFTLNVNDLPLQVAINKKNLVGQPSIGMRFLGTCWIQGTIEIAK